MSYITPIGCSGGGPLGMADGTVTNEQITASSQRRGFEPWRARLGNTRSWTPATQNPTSPWIQVDLNDKVVITGIQTQGGSFISSGQTYNIWVKTLRVQYGDNDKDLYNIMDGDQVMVSIVMLTTIEWVDFKLTFLEEDICYDHEIDILRSLANLQLRYV